MMDEPENLGLIYLVRLCIFDTECFYSELQIFIADLI